MNHEREKRISTHEFTSFEASIERTMQTYEHSSFGPLELSDFICKKVITKQFTHISLLPPGKYEIKYLEIVRTVKENLELGWLQNSHLLAELEDFVSFHV